MGADSPDDSLLFAGRLSGAGPGAAVGGGQLVPAAGVQPAGRGRVDRAARATRACCSWTATTPGRGLGLVRRLKSDAFTAIVPVTDARRRPPRGAGPGLVRRGVGRGDHRRSSRRPSSGPGWMPCWCGPSGTCRCIRPPGSRAPPRSSGRSGAGSSPNQEFAVCYADLDHFKEFNDRYSYYDGDRVIYLLSRILHDVVKGLWGRAASWGTSAATISSSSSRRRRSARSAVRSWTCSTP